MVRIDAMYIFLRWVDNINEWTGKTARWLIVPLVFLIVMQVILRYVFRNPTLWAWDVNIQLQAALVVLGGGYALLHKSHVSVDVIISRLSPRKIAIIDTITGPVLIAAVAVLLWRLVLYAWKSILMNEAYTSTLAPPIYPIKVLIVIGTCLLLLQGIANWLRSLMTAVKREGAGK